MVRFDRFTLDNGLRVIVHQDKSTPLVAFNLLYDVGSRDEDPSRTGFAHLFEHLMFGGSGNVPVFDEPLEKAGGQNNAFTSSDITNYYMLVPGLNVETAFWIESDRMLNLALDHKKIEVQKNVVMEEYKQRYLNQPYGDVWLLLRKLAYKVHPYRWPTIGMDLSHIAEADEQEVSDFFNLHYCPQAAILTLAGNITTERAKMLSEKWFGPIHRPYHYRRRLPAEPEQTGTRRQTEHREVPVDAIYIAFHMPDRKSSDFYTADLLSDIFSSGESSRLTQRLVREKNLFTEVSSFVSGDIDEGLMVFSGKISEGVDLEQAEQALVEEIDKAAREEVSMEELERVKNKMDVTLGYGEIKVLDKAMNLSYFELLGDADLLNREQEKYHAVTIDGVLKFAGSFLNHERSSTLYYLSG